MDERQYHLMVPRRLDDPPKFLFWDFDVAVICMGVVMLGILAGFLLTSIVLGLFVSYLVQKAKAGQQKGYGMHFLYWHLPLRMFKRTPASCDRVFIG